MSGDGPTIKFSPFEALLIGEHNSIIKRKPMKNAVYLTNLNNKRREFDLRELFDVKDDRKHWDGQPKKVKRIRRCMEKPQNFNPRRVGRSPKRKTEKKNNKKPQLSKVRFKPEFRFKETLEERIVQKIQKRKKKLKTNIVGNGFLTQLRKPNPNRHSLRGKNGQFIRKEPEKSEPANLSDYLKDLCGVKKNETPKPDTSDGDSSDSDRAKYFTESVLNDISLQYYRSVFPEEFGISILPNQMEPSDFEQDKDLRGILDESNKDGEVEGEEEEEEEEDDDDDDDDEEDEEDEEEVEEVEVEEVEGEEEEEVVVVEGEEEEEQEENGNEGENEDDDESTSPVNYIESRRKGLRMYERKRTGKDEVVRFQKNAKENHFVNKGTRSSNFFRNHAIISNKRNGIIDERPAKSNHLIWNNKFRSLFYKTACGSEMYLGNLTKTIVLNSSFGRLPNT